MGSDEFDEILSALDRESARIRVRGCACGHLFPGHLVLLRWPGQRRRCEMTAAAATGFDDFETTAAAATGRAAAEATPTTAAVRTTGAPMTAALAIR